MYLPSEQTLDSLLITPPPANSASSITRDVSRIIRENIATRHGAQPTQAQADHQYHAHPPFNTTQSSANEASNTNAHTQTYLRINILQQGKRLLPRFDIPAGQCPDIDTVKQFILRRYPALSGLGDGDANSQQARDSAATWKFKVWLPDGLVPVQNEKDWAIALLSADTVDWMDGEMKVLVEIEGSNTQH